MEKSDKKEQALVEGFARYTQTKGLADLLGKRVEFAYIPIQEIEVRKQVRTDIDTESESFKALKESIKEKGVIEPIICRDIQGKTVLIAGERRLRACQELGLVNIPVRFICDLTEEDVLAIQLIENLQRENINPIDEAKGYFVLLNMRAGVENLDDCINQLITYERSPERVKNEFAVTVTAIQKISGKSTPSVRRLLLLLKLPERIKQALLDGRINLTSAYIFAANLDHPRLEEIFEQACAGKFTKDTLADAFQKKEKKKVKKEHTPITKFYSSIMTLRKELAKGRSAVDFEEAQRLISELKELIGDIEKSIESKSSYF